MRALHPFILLSADEQSWPLDTDKASVLAERLRLSGADRGRELADKIDLAVVLRSFVNPDRTDKELLLEAISGWVAEEGEEAVGEQVLTLRDAVRADLRQYV